MWAMRADRGSKMLAATVQVGRESTWRNRSRACDIMGPPFPLGPCPQSNLTPDLFSRDLHRDYRTSEPVEGAKPLRPRTPLSALVLCRQPLGLVCFVNGTSEVLHQR